MSSGAGAANNHGSSKKRVRTTTNTTTDDDSPHQRLRLNDTLFDSLGTRYATRYCGNSEELLELLRAAKVISSCQGVFPEGLTSPRTGNTKHTGGGELESQPQNTKHRGLGGCATARAPCPPGPGPGVTRGQPIHLLQRLRLRHQKHTQRQLHVIRRMSSSSARGREGS